MLNFLKYTDETGTQIVINVSHIVLMERFITGSYDKKVHEGTKIWTDVDGDYEWFVAHVNIDVITSKIAEGLPLTELFAEY